MFVGLTLAFVRSPRQPISGLPRTVVVERSAALAVITCSVVSAHTLSVDLRDGERGRRKGQRGRKSSLVTRKTRE